jgi:predicted nucleotide-binding protein (sugar kinase/HSP70/actin superfamily)
MQTNKAINKQNYQEFNYGDIETAVMDFEQAERKRLNLQEAEIKQWHDPKPKNFTKAERAHTTILVGGLTMMQDQLIKAALLSLGVEVVALDCPDTQALHFGKEFGNRGQCNPTYFTVGNLIKHLVHLRDVQGISSQDIIKNYVFLTAGACGPCRFGTYVTEYRKALRDSGFADFRVLSFQQKFGVQKVSGDQTGLEFNLKFFFALLQGMLIGDLFNVMGYRLRPYEIEKGQTDAVLDKARQITEDALRYKKSLIVAMFRCRKLFKQIKIDTSVKKPKVMIIGEFWAMTTEGAGNYHLQRFLESEGAEVDIQIVTAWLLYMLWQAQHDTKRRLELRNVDKKDENIKPVNGQMKWLKVFMAEKVLRLFFKTYSFALGLNKYKLPDMNEIAKLASDYYHLELRGGEGHMEVGKVIQAVEQKKAHMIISVKPFGCMPSSGVSDGVQSLVTKKYPEVIFCPVETTGDGEVNFQSRVLMFLFKAKQRVRNEQAMAEGVR